MQNYLDKEKMENKKILFVMTSLTSGGAERELSVISKYLIKDFGYQISIALLLKNETFYKLDKSIEIIDLTSKKSLLYWKKNLKKYYKKNKYDYVVCYTAEVNAVTLFSLFFSKAKIFFKEISNPKSKERSTIKNKVLKFFVRFNTHVIFQSEYQQLCYPRIVQKKSTIIYNPVEIEEQIVFYKNQHRTIVCVGRFVPVKNHLRLIDEFKNFIEYKNSNYCLYLYGEGPLKKDICDKINSLDLSGRVFVKEPTREIFEVLKQSDCFILPSISEGLPNALVEALITGIPVITSNWPGYSEFVENRKTGIVFDLCENDSIYKSLKTFSESDDKFLLQMSENEKKLKDVFDPLTIAKKWNDLFKKR